MKGAAYVATPSTFTVTLTTSKPFTVSKTKHVTLTISGLLDSQGGKISDYVQSL